MVEFIPSHTSEKAYSMKIKDIMSKDVEVVSPDATLHEIASKMQKRDCGSVIVVKDDRLVGMITDRDIAVRCIAGIQMRRMMWRVI
jgi:isoamylase